MPLGPDDLPDDGNLLRRIHPDHLTYESDGSVRVTSAAFKDPCMSVDVEYFMAEYGLTWQHSLTNFPKHFLVRFKACVARSLEQEIVHCPIEEDTQSGIVANPVHGEVRGRKTQSKARKFAINSEWVKSPADE